MSESITAAPKWMLPINKTITKQDKIKAAHDFEEMFIKFFFKSIIPQNTEGGLFGTSHSSEMYRSMWIDSAAKQTAKRGVGIAKYIMKALDRNDPLSSSEKGDPVYDIYA
jgi:Rod binding domain-containing protein